jgi:hypothetical protein
MHLREGNGRDVTKQLGGTFLAPRETTSVEYAVYVHVIMLDIDGQQAERNCPPGPSHLALFWPNNVPWWAQRAEDPFALLTQVVFSNRSAYLRSISLSQRESRFCSCAMLSGKLGDDFDHARWSNERPGTSLIIFEAVWAGFGTFKFKNTHLISYNNEFLFRFRL